MNEEKLGVYKLAEELGVSHTTIYTWANKKDLPYTTETIGIKVMKRFLLSEVKVWMENQIK